MLVWLGSGLGNGRFEIPIVVFENIFSEISVPVHSARTALTRPAVTGELPFLLEHSRYVTTVHASGRPWTA
jgi:hypothetical protein